MSQLQEAEEGDRQGKGKEGCLSGEVEGEWQNYLQTMWQQQQQHKQLWQQQEQQWQLWQQ